MSFNPYNILIKYDLYSKVRKVLTTLTPREEKIVKIYFGIDTDEKDMWQIADDMFVTHERIRQIRDKVLRRLRYISRAKPLKHYRELNKSFDWED